MKKIISILLAVLMLLSCTGCKKQAEDLKFYVLKKADVSAEMGTDVLLQTAKTKGRVAFTGADLKGWLWSEHKVRLNHVNVKGSPNDGGSVLFQTEKDDVFLLVLGNRVLYTGSFDTGAEGVFIADAGETDFKIYFENPFGDLKDPRGNERLYDYLAEQQLLASELK